MGRSPRVALLAVGVLALACGGTLPPGGPSATATPSVAAAAQPTGAAATPTAAIVTATPSPQPGTVGSVHARIDFHDFRLADGTLVFTEFAVPAGVVLPAPGVGTWTSSWREPGFAFTRLVPSWNALTPEGTWIDVEVQARRAAGGETAWYRMGRWALGDAIIKRASLDGQRDSDARVETDTLFASVPLAAYRVRVTLSRNTAPTETPVLRLVAAVVSDDAAVRAAPPSAHAGTVRDLAVPQYSQEIHAGEYPEYDGGGEAWCSPTSTTMVLGHWGRGPTPADVAWVDKRYADPGVDHAARYTYDATYRGTGNWSFNTAYAATYGLRAFVTQLRSLAEAERFIAAGIPLVASVKVPPGGLPGFLLPQGAPGHLLVIRGSTASGDVVVNDPAALSNAQVRRVYPRGAFERVWIGGSGGIVYVIHPADVPLPARVDGATANW